MADHIVYRCISMRYMTGYEGWVSATVDSAQTGISIAGATTLGSTRMVLAISAGAIDATGFQGSSDWQSDDADVTAESFLAFCQTDTGVGGGINSGAGTLASAGGSGNWTSSWNSSTKQANGSLACFGTQLPETYDLSTGEGTDDVDVTLPIFGGGFYLLLLVQTANEEVETPTGWTLVGAVGTGTAGVAGSTRLTVFAADADDDPPAPTLSIVAGGGGETPAESTGHRRMTLLGC